MTAEGIAAEAFGDVVIDCLISQVRSERQAGPDKSTDRIFVRLGRAARVGDGRRCCAYTAFLTVPVAKFVA
ncbi:MAG: hypothetical protein ACLPVY_13460 [Acidimicrobiia bacterium]